MTVLLQFLIEHLFGLERILFVPPVDVVDLLHCALVASSNTDLLELCTFLPRCFFLVELLKLLPQFVRLLSFVLTMLFLIILVLPISLPQVFLVLFRYFGLLGLDVLLILCYFFRRFIQLPLEGGPSHHIIIFLLSIEFQLILRALDGKINLIFLTLIRKGVLSACCLTTIDLEMFLGRS